MVKRGFISTLVLMGVEKMAERYISEGKAMYKSEIVAISKILNVPVSKILLIQLVYEMHACCTTISVKTNLCQDEGQTSANAMYRTMDWPMAFLKKLTCKLIFKKAGTVLYEAISWAGYVGILTAMVPGKDGYALAVNFRRTSHGSLMANLEKTLNMAWPVGYLCRSLLAKKLDGHEMETALKEAYLISPCYFTLCTATFKSIVIIRNSSDTVGVKESSDTKEKNASYLIQTNIDDPVKCKDRVSASPNILYSKERESLARRIIEDRKDGWTTLGELLNFGQYPIVNEDTVYVSVMCPSLGILCCKV
jgi:hypothetical protein